jgi:hypothetical protein
MARYKHIHSAWQVYADVIMLLFMWAISLVCMLIISVNFSIHTKGDIIPKAEYLITMTWDKDRDSDLDLWLEAPNGNVIMYTNKEVANISLDRDSRGKQTNETVMPDGTHAVSVNQEVITIRVVIPGDYNVAVSYYDGADENANHFNSGEEIPAAKIEALLEVNKVNPKYTQVAGAKIELTKVKETRNVFSFHLDADGTYTALPVPEEDVILRVAKGGMH